MDEIIEKSRRNVFNKTRCSIDMDLNAFMAKALENSGAPDIETTMNNFIEKVKILCCFLKLWVI
jgi:hypothetical protein